MRRLALVFGTVSFALALSAGAPSAAAPVPKHLMPKEPPLVYPAVVGATWVYEENDKKEVTVRVSKVEDSDGAKLITTEFSHTGEKWSHDVTLSVSAKGVFLHAEHGRDFKPPWCILKLPHKQGESWPAQGVGSDMTTGPVEGIETAAGKIQATRVEWEHAPGSKARYWYAPGMGLVRRDADFNLSLKSFTRGKE